MIRVYILLLVQNSHPFCWQWLRGIVIWSWYFKAQMILQFYPIDIHSSTIHHTQSQIKTPTKDRDQILPREYLNELSSYDSFTKEILQFQIKGSYFPMLLEQIHSECSCALNVLTQTLTNTMTEEEELPHSIDIDIVTLIIELCT